MKKNLAISTFLTISSFFAISLSNTTIISANQNRVTADQLRISTNNYIGTDFRPGNPNDQNFTTRFDAGTHTGFMRSYKGGLGTGETSITVTFSEDSILNIVINEHMQTSEPTPHYHNNLLVGLALAAQGPYFTYIESIPKTSYNFALALDWTMRIAEQPFQFVYVNRLISTNSNVGLTNGVHIATVPARNDDLTLALGVTNGNIDVVSITHRDTPGVVDYAVVAMAQQIINTQSLEVDVVTGATNTSNAVIEALSIIDAGTHTVQPAPAVAQLTPAYIAAAQVAWGNAIIAISQAHHINYDYETIARYTLNNLYAFDYGVLFSTTTGSVRSSFDSVLDYLIGSNGFALDLHTYITFEPGQVIVNGNQAIWSGYVNISNHFGNRTTFAKTIGYMIGRDGAIRINFHHSEIIDSY